MPLGVGGGDYFKPAPGRYIGQFVSLTDGPPQNYPATADKPAHVGQTMRWGFALYNLDWTPVLDPKKPGTVAIVESLSSDTVGVGRGTPAKARVWLTKLLESKGIAWTEPTNETLPGMAENAKGAFVYLSFHGTKGLGSDDMERMIPQPGVAAAAAPVAPPPVAPVAPVAVAAPVPVAAPAFPVPAVAVAGPLPVPAAPAFVPAPVPTAPAAVEGAVTVPSMPFPVAAQ